MIYDIYTYNGDVSVTIGENTYSFEEALKSKKITIDKIIKQVEADVNNGLAKQEMYLNGGSSEYRYKKIA